MSASKDEMSGSSDDEESPDLKLNDRERIHSISSFLSLSKENLSSDKEIPESIHDKERIYSSSSLLSIGKDKMSTDDEMPEFTLHDEEPIYRSSSRMSASEDKMPSRTSSRMSASKDKMPLRTSSRMSGSRGKMRMGKETPEWMLHDTYAPGVSTNRILTRSQTAFLRVRNNASDLELFSDSSRHQPPGMPHLMEVMKGKYGSVPNTIITRSSGQYFTIDEELCEKLEPYKNYHSR